MFNVQWSMFNGQCSMVNVQWSMVNEVRERFAPEGQVESGNQKLTTFLTAIIFKPDNHLGLSITLIVFQR